MKLPKSRLLARRSSIKQPGTPQPPVIPKELHGRELSGISDGEHLEAVRVGEAVLVGLVAKSITVESAVFENTELSSCIFKKASGSDVMFENCLLFGTNLDGSGLHRVIFRKGMYSGLVLSDAIVEDVIFEGTKLNLANFRVSKLKRVHFIDCDLSEADFQGAELKSVVFNNCNLTEVEFTGCTMSSVDMRGSNIASVKGTGALKGATIDITQLVTISQRMASELGITVE